MIGPVKITILRKRYLIWARICVARMNFNFLTNWQKSDQVQVNKRPLNHTERSQLEILPRDHMTQTNIGEPWLKSRFHPRPHRIK